jgi:hypothetical protein
MALQGAHQGAQKSTTTGMSLRVRWRSKLSVVTAMGLPSKIARWQRPHFAS